MSKFGAYPSSTLTYPITSYDTTQQMDLGSKIVSPDGREYRYALVGGSPLVAGTLLQSSAEVTAQQNLTPTAATLIGDTTISVTTGGAVTANQFAGGFVVITTSTGVGYQYKIFSHGATSGAAALTINLEDPITVATATTSRVDLVANPYAGVIINPTAASGTVVGVALIAAPAGSYCFVQTRGLGTVLADGAVAVGTMVVASNGTAGAVEAGADATDLQSLVGQAVTAISTGEYGAVDFRLS